MKAIIFDCEANGLPLSKTASYKEVDMWPRITQVGFQHIDLDTGIVLHQFDTLIYPDGWTIPTVEELTEKGSKNPYFFEENNMSTERCKQFGVHILNVFDVLVPIINDSDYIVCHNIGFDKPVLQSEMYRYGIKAEKALIPICTMLGTVDFCQIPGKYGYKWPSLQELHFKLFEHHFSDAHDAMADVVATGKCLLELIRIGFIKL